MEECIGINGLMNMLQFQSGVMYARTGKGENKDKQWNITQSIHDVTHWPTIGLQTNCEV